MRKFSLFATIITVTVIALSSVTVPTAGFAADVGVNVQINGYLPAPPGVHIYMDAGRPYYVERDRRVYIEKDRKYKKPKKYKDKHHKEHEYRGHDDHGHDNGKHKGNK
jgi:hypothetical protein